MSMPRRSRSRMSASVLQAGPIVQMIFARRGADRTVSSGGDGGTDVCGNGFAFLFFRLAIKSSPIELLLISRTIVET
jgi:hypothetical protein